MSVAVVGGGAIGLATAFWLHRAGHDVTLIERSSVASGASWGNAGEICPTTITPLAEPSLVARAMSNIFSSTSALAMRPTAVAKRLPFFLQLLGKANMRSYLSGTDTLIEFARETLSLFEQMHEEIGAFDYVEDDYLYVHSSENKAVGGRESLLNQFDTTIECGEVLIGEALHAVEPSLGTGAKAGYFLKAQAFVDPGEFCLAIADYLRARGVTIMEHAEVTHLGDSGRSVEVSTGEMTSTYDTCIVAAGVWSRQILKGIGARIPLYPGKGYSFNIDSKIRPSHVLKLVEAYVGVVPMNSGVRVAGTMEFAGFDARLNQRRIASIVKAASPFLGDVDWTSRTNEWTGFRPMTPDGLPFVGPVTATQNVWVAAGHNMLGLMLAPSTGKHIADALDNSPARVLSKTGLLGR